MRFKWILFFFSSLLLGGCFEYDDVVYQGFSNVKVGKPVDGQTSISFDIQLDNPNNYKIKIKPSDLTVYIGGKELGDIHLTKTVVIQKKSSKSYPLIIDAKLKDIAKAGLGSLVEMATKKTVTIRLKGFVRGSIYGITQKRYVDQSKDIETGQLLQFIGL